MRCCICNSEIDEIHSHNAEPFKKGKCCEVCNAVFVIPKRLQILKEMSKDEM